MASDRDLTLRAAALARSAPRAFEDFLGALSVFTDQIKTDCIQSPLDLLPVAQGRAQFAARLHDLLANCISSADKIEGRRK